MMRRRECVLPRKSNGRRLSERRKAWRERDGVRFLSRVISRCVQARAFEAANFLRIHRLVHFYGGTA